jgi:hypothetical protein
MKKKTVLGIDNDINPKDLNGVWDINEVTDLRSLNKPLYNSADQEFTYQWSENGSDPYRQQTVVHLSKPSWLTHIFSDRSGNNWNEYYESINYHTVGRFHPSYYGPRYPHSTWFHDQYYTVTNYSDIVLGNSAFTLQFWVRLSRFDTSEHYLMGKGAQAARSSGSGWVVYITAAGNIGWYDAHSNSSTQTSQALTRDVWYHVAIVRESTSSNQLKIYVDGTLSGTGTSGGNFTGTENLYIGRDRLATAATYFGGYLADLRLTTEAEYTSNFTRPSAMLDDDTANTVFSLSSRYPWQPTNPDLHPQNATITLSGQYVTRVVENPFVTNIQTAHGYTSVQSINSTDAGVLRVEDRKTGNDSLKFGTGPFTVEMWVRVNDYQRDTAYLGKGSGNQATAGATGWSFGMDTNGYLYWSNGANARMVDTNTAKNAVQWGSWAHIAAVREGTGSNQFKMYVNGRIVYTGTLATNYNQTDPLRLATDRSRQYWAKYHQMSCLKISKVARYTDNFAIDLDTFFDTMMTTDQNTSLMTYTTAGEPLRAFGDHWVNEGRDRAGVYVRTDAMRVGQHTPIRPGGYSIINVENGQASVYARTTQGDFNFGTGDFSVELWVNHAYSWSDHTSQKIIFDNRVFWNDSGMVLRYNSRLGLDLVTGNSTRLWDRTANFEYDEWHHICVQRTSGKLALYVDGHKKAEIAYNGNISAPGSDWFFMNGSYPNLWYTNHFNGYISDIRVVKNSGAYSENNRNPDKFVLPRSVLQPTSDGNTVLLTGARNHLRDYSGRDNFVWLGNRDESNYTSSYSTYVVEESPYKVETDFDANNIIYSDNSDNNGGWSLRTELVNANAVKRDHEYIQHMSGPWTVEMWMYLHNTNPASITNQTHLYTATGNSQDGFQVVHHYAGNTNSYNDITMIFRNNKYATTPQWINTSSGDSNLKPHSWNHVAFVYDPTRSSPMAIHCNGKRVATRAAFTAGDRNTTMYQLETSSVDCTNVRISRTARYNNDSTTYDVPTARWVNDSDTTVLVRNIQSVPDTAAKCGRYWHGTAQPSSYSKWGNGSLLIPNITSNDTAAYDGVEYYVYNYWANKAQDIRWGDFTIEGWASWWDVGSGGKAFNTTAPGSCLIHWQNTIWIGLDTAGAWKVEWANTSTIYNTVSTGVTCAVRSDNAWNHFAVVRYKGDWLVFIDGVYYGNLIGSNWGTYASNGPTTSFNSDFININNVKIGKEYDNIFANSWSGFLEDFRITRAARYWVRDVNGVPTMCHTGTNVPALPTGPFPTR